MCCHARLAGMYEINHWIPAFAGMTVKSFIILTDRGSPAGMTQRQEQPSPSFRPACSRQANAGIQLFLLDISTRPPQAGENDNQWLIHSATGRHRQPLTTPAPLESGGLFQTPLCHLDRLFQTRSTTCIPAGEPWPE